jgi:hypothetical protein
MKTAILPFLLVFSLAIFSCNKEDKSTITYESHGEITGLDLRLCMCCGGWIMSFPTIDDKGNTIQREANFSRLPEGAKFTLENRTFPVPVRFNYTEYDNPACGQIRIDEIELD